MAGAAVGRAGVGEICLDYFDGDDFPTWVRADLQPFEEYQYREFRCWQAPLFVVGVDYSASRRGILGAAEVKRSKTNISSNKYDFPAAAYLPSHPDHYVSGQLYD